MRKIIAVAADYYNTLWLARSLGMSGFCPTISNKKTFVKLENRRLVA